MAENKIDRGYQAETLLNHPIIKETFDKLDGEYHARWRNASTVEAREDCFRYVKVLERILGDLSTIAQTGHLERARQAELERGKKGFAWPTMNI
jgi:hypothetical protein